ncbi:alpha/beta hydrolase [Aquisalimonas asiatica]|uniref:Phospholipase/carboxylesterase n=1 Tax=Aquisalimonas asiatica TaxID=406100 RepID=A0A1H8QPT0_9GAMM|nr:alpha/beta hydrolase [Aquisalimonas asiatica]SEO55874.1 phospholipase/carboxylesterase [Aquisalimonas asiatica]
MTQAQLSFVHRFQAGENTDRPPVLLLHGTGGNETDLLPLGRLVAPGAALLSPRGQVLEGGVMPRFFRRLAEGVFDEADLRERTHELADFVSEARAAYGLDAPIAVGFSNGANIAAAMLLLRPGVLRGAALLRAMVPFAEPPQVADAAGQRVLLSSGREDPIIAVDNASRLAGQLQHAGIETTHHILDAGHGLTNEDVALTRDWINASF